MSLPVIVVKRRGRKEYFDERKVYASVYSACMSRYLNEIKCEKLADTVTKSVKSWLKTKKTISSKSIRKKVELELRKRDKDVVFHYDQHIPNLLRL